MKEENVLEFIMAKLEHAQQSILNYRALNSEERASNMGVGELSNLSRYAEAAFNASESLFRLRFIDNMVADDRADLGPITRKYIEGGKIWKI